MKYYGLKIFIDNYIWLLIKDSSVIAIDCGAAEPLLNFVTENKLNLTHVLVTHYHSDHVAGLQQIKAATNTKIIASAKTAELIESNLIDQVIINEDDLKLNNLTISPLSVAGHSKDHTAYFIKEQKWLFSGDALFTLGCGKAFYSLELLFNSLQKIVQKLPPDTLIFPGHNYLASNIKFLAAINYFNFRAKTDDFNNTVTIPSTLAVELYYNPFLNTNNHKFKKLLKQENLSDFAFFSYLRQLKDNF